MSELFLAMTGLAFLGFALFGLIEAIRLVFASPKRAAPGDDVAAACRVLNRMRRSGEIGWTEYQKTWTAIRLAFPHADLPQLLGAPPLVAETAKDEQPQTTEPIVADGAPLVESELIDAEVVEAELIDGPLVDVQTPQGEIARPKIEDEESDRPTDLPTVISTEHAPRRSFKPKAVGFDDLPAEAPVAARRSWSELLAGFMQEKNIRWGELASGILIVGSAVGLIVSLRAELRDAVPYFPALLFMLITAAIHGAGVYTLKRWRLRNTSRGILVIGLLLVPLNFLSACILTGDRDDRRDFGDPAYWIAVATGIAAFSAMTWTASRCVLRRRHVPLFLAVMICSLSLLVANRVDDPSTESWTTWLLGLPALVGLSISGVGAIPAVASRRRWSQRAARRLWLCLGVGAFAFFVALSLIVIRSPRPLHAVIALAPIVACGGVLAAWLGLTVQQGSVGRDHGARRVVGAAIGVLGLLVAMATIVVSIAVPTTLAATSLLVGAGLLLIAWNRSFMPALPLAWGSASLGALAATHCAVGKFAFDQWASGRQWIDATTSAATGICLMTLGAAIVVIQKLLLGKRSGAANMAASDRWNTLSGAAIAALGSVAALAASLLHPENAVDVQVATALLGVCFLGAALAAIRIGKALTANLATGLLAVFLWHALLWNQFLAPYVVAFTDGIDCRWTILSLATATILAIIAALRREAVGRGRTVVRLVVGKRTLRIDEAAATLAAWSIVAGIAAIVGAALVVPYESTLATKFVGVAVAAALLVAWAGRHELTSAALVAVSGFGLTVVVAETALRGGWLDSLVSVRHGAFQLTALAIWSIFWSCAEPIARGMRLRKWLTRDRGAAARIGCYWVVVSTIAFILAGLLPHVAAELFGAIDVQLDASLSLAAEIDATSAMLALVALAVVARLLIAPTDRGAVGLLAVWLLAWATGAAPFEGDKAVASAERWLLPIGGALAALAIGLRSEWLPHWNALRRKLRLARANDSPQLHVQRLIDMALAAVVFAVLLISTIAISCVMLYGGAALGGPLRPSLFGSLRKDVSYGGPIAVLVGTFLWYAITERRSWLAVAGSLVFQYVVLLSIVLLFLSPHPKLASTWFLNIMQATSLGMSLYGFVWHRFRERIGAAGMFGLPGLRQLDVHTAINASLVASLALLIAQRYFFLPTQSAGWINEAGGWLGVAALGAVTGLGVVVWRERLRQLEFGLIGAVGLAVAAFSASVVGRYQAAPWEPFRTVMVGAAVVALVQLAWLWRREKQSHYARRYRGRALVFGPLILSGAAAHLFALRGCLSDSTFDVGYLLVFSALLAAAIVYGLLLQSAWAAWLAAFVSLFVGYQLYEVNPRGWISSNEAPHLWMLGWLVIALVWQGYYLIERRRRADRIRRTFLAFCWFMTFSAPWWLLLVALVEHTSAIPILSMPVGFASLALGTLLVASNLWNDRAKFRLFAPFVLSLTAPLLALNRLALGDERWAALAVLSAALVALFWGHAYRRRSALRHYGKQWRVPRLSALERAWRRDLPVGQCGVLVVAACAALACLFHCDDRLARYAMAVAPLIAGAALVPLADCASRRPLQLTALAAMTFGAVLLASAELSTAQMAIDAFHLPIRATLALGMTVFLHGWLLPRVLSAESAWHEAIRTAAATTSALAMGAFAWLISTEATRFIPDVGCGVPFVAAAAVSAVIGGMIAGLIAIAVLPKHDPLALSLEGRKGYVYLAQAVAAALVVHLYLTLPWLFQLGIRQYWPYLAMTLAFGGVGMANLLSKRKLLVLSEPIFHAAAALPIVAACAFWGIDSKADASLLMLFAGVVYLAIGVSRHALWSGLAAVAFANLSLWLFYDKFPGMAFLTHPQLWLIPPAVSVLIAAQLNRDRFAAGQLSALRYVCAAIIYLSSTSEIITSGWGAALWPPMGLAALAVAGILAGMLLQTRPFLYLGSAFLLFAMISMVAHAQQRLHHVWPWWAFGLCLGAAILAMFGLFEKRRNDMQSIFNRLREWD